MSKKSPTSKARTARHPYSIRFREEYGAFGALEREQDWTCATSSWGNKTTPRANDARQQKGHRILFDKDTQVDAWYTARMLKRLTPMHQRWVRLLAEALLGHQMEAEAGYHVQGIRRDVHQRSRRAAQAQRGP